MVPSESLTFSDTVVLVLPSPTSPAPPLKFRTLTLRQSGFKPRGVSINPALPTAPPSLNAKSVSARRRPGLTWPSSRMALLRTLPALSGTRPASGSMYREMDMGFWLEKAEVELGPPHEHS